MATRISSEFASVTSPRSGMRGSITCVAAAASQDDDHRLLAVWAAECAVYVLHHLERGTAGRRPAVPVDRPRSAGARGEKSRGQRRARLQAMPTPRPGICAWQRACRVRRRPAAAVGHVAAHGHGAAASTVTGGASRAATLASRAPMRLPGLRSCERSGPGSPTSSGSRSDPPAASNELASSGSSRDGGTFARGRDRRASRTCGGNPSRDDQPGSAATGSASPTRLPRTRRRPIQIGESAAGRYQAAAATMTKRAATSTGFLRTMPRPVSVGAAPRSGLRGPHARLVARDGARKTRNSTTKLTIRVTAKAIIAM